MAQDPNAKPTGSKKKRRSKQQEVATPLPEDLTFVDHALNSVFDMSRFTAASLTIAGLSCLASYILMKDRWDKAAAQKVTAGGPPNARTPGGGPQTEGQLVSADGRVSTEAMSRAFSTAVQAQSSQHGARVMHQFYQQLADVRPQQCDEPGRMIGANFLFWFYRVENSKEKKKVLGKTQALHVTNWLDFDDCKCEMDQFQQKFDLLFSLAFSQRSVPHLRKLFAAMSTHPRMAEALSMDDSHLKLVSRGGGGAAAASAGSGAPPRPQPQDQNKDRFAAAFYQCACVLGHWDVVSKIGAVVLQMDEDSRVRARPLNSWKSRTFEQPMTCPDYGYFMKVSEQISSRMQSFEEPPAVFGEWNILEWKFANADPSVSVDENCKYVLYDERMLDVSMSVIDDSDSGTVQFLPSNCKQTATVPTGIKIWGRMMQLLTPATASNGAAFIPVVGTHTDSTIFASYEREITIRGADKKLSTFVKKVTLEIERLPTARKVELRPVVPLTSGGRDMFGGESILEGEAHEEEGYEWEGTLTVTNTPIVSRSMSALWGMFMSGASKPPSDEDSAAALPPATTQVYHCQLVIDKKEGKH